jgi:hypothetical protein
MKLQKDLREFIELLNAREARYLVVGAFAVAYHGHPRYTGDIDLFVDASVENGQRLLSAIKDFGFSDTGLTLSDLTQPDQVIQLGVSPNRIDLMTFLSGVSFENAWASRDQGEIDGVRVSFISREMLKRNKTASGRFQDLADLEHL